jgi:ABC-type antimicrobial peptide transport system permease subunit
LVGLLIGGLISFEVAQRFHMHVSVGPGIVTAGLGLSALTGLLAGVAPARRAARLNPADALR